MSPPLATGPAWPVEESKELRMLLEQLAAQAARPPRYDWEAYYRWLFAELTGREVDGYRFWLCRRCATVNLLVLPARHGTCRNCRVTFLSSV